MVWDTILDYLSMAGAFIFMVFFFGSCVFVHELGHFLAAKWRGLHIDAFSIGFKNKVKIVHLFRKIHRFRMNKAACYDKLIMQP